MPDQPIDMVFTYVDGSEPAYAARRAAARAQAGEPGQPMAEPARWHTGLGEIGYGVRSVLACMPWIRTIHIVTDGQMPPVDPELVRQGRVRIVDHGEIIPARYRPVFASTVIESFLHRIPGLSGIYLYNNDDFMHGSPIPASAFRQAGADGRPVLRLRTVPALVRAMIRLASDCAPPFLPQANPYTSGIANAARLCRRRLGLPWSGIVFPRHVTQVYRVATARRLESLLADELHAARQRRFRGPEQVSWSTLAYSAECHWHAARRVPWRPCRGDEALFIDFSRLRGPSSQARAWQRVAASAAPFMCLNNIPAEQARAYHAAMAARGLQGAHKTCPHGKVA